MKVTDTKGENTKAMQKSERIVGNGNRLFNKRKSSNCSKSPKSDNL